ncbi:winged helix-turn-helix transcriptional regulator [Acinetobacter nosocomialis]|uniref:winged helix-turn-helix transcriptional regulator n=1 Tax=Acinetobacter nosocomialis TaxID=106654 RepID=UPI00280EEAFE|nr:helix-turn-helix domain-containing protein [Acinetobacter nosocomialis]MDQ9028064.1 helix-turn-helix domain-containing protein [Acinetobacter nosocomialis]MDQ9045340.1 helix-turn-helix domain-containing protein [Acinetobacter nosocomialis]MDQ9082761.1 helix-turn-helix domain-containing protein [Acinetobacter nosocomialis]
MGTKNVKVPTLTERVRRGDLFTGENNCQSREAFAHVTSLWGVICLIALRDGTHRYSELRRKANGVSEKMLTLTLQHLEKDGFIRRTSYPVVPPHVEYDLTLLGEEVAKHVAALADWLEVNLSDIKAASLASEDG